MSISCLLYRKRETSKKRHSASRIAIKSFLVVLWLSLLGADTVVDGMLTGPLGQCCRYAKHLFTQLIMFTVGNDIISVRGVALMMSACAS